MSFKSCWDSRISHINHMAVDWWNLEVDFYGFFCKFSREIYSKGKREKYSTKWKITKITISQEQYCLWSWFLAHLCKMIISPGFFSFFDIFTFQAVGGVKGQKMTQDDKKFCLLHFISQEPYIMWLSFMIHLCKMIFVFHHLLKI